MVGPGELSMGHARALITAADPEALADEVVRRGLSVRETEKLARARQADRSAAAAADRVSRAPAPISRRSSGSWATCSASRSRSRTARKGGSVTLGYSTLDQLDMICQRLSGEKI